MSEIHTNGTRVNGERGRSEKIMEYGDDGPSNDGTDRIKSVVESVLFQAALRPEAVAVASGLGVLTYQELEIRSAELATRLQALGVGADDVVGLCLPRSVAMVVGALAILRAGGAYLPIDPADPQHRLDFLLEDAEVPVLITTQGAELVLQSKRQVIALDNLGRIIDAPASPAGTEPREAFGVRRIPALSPTGGSDNVRQSLAYVIYTSGSTGQPKGVEITHDGLMNLVQWHRQAFKVTAADRATQLARVGFDAAVWEIWPYLTAGASVHIPPEDTLNDPETLRDWLVAQAITISFVPTPMAERLLSLSWPANIALRTMLTGGDALHRHPPENLPFVLVNNYGPTECTVVTTSGLVPSRKSAERLPPIGLPIANTRVYILDEALRPVPAGTPGELYIGGAGLARGYRRRPDLTAERFVADPFTADRSQRLFKTGDLVQYLPDGQIAFLGRLDEQVKVRGFRIEPHEIVAALDAHSEISQSAVVAQEISPEERRLVAYFVSRNGSPPTLNELRSFLSTRLPDYMIPAMFVRLEALPLTANGKVDRAALPLPDSANTLRDDAFTAPRTEVEKAVAGILAPLLGIEQVDVNANFFALGGHSLLGTQLIARLRGAFGVELPLRAVFEAPTVAELSSEIDRLLLARLETLSEEEAQRLLDSTPAVYAV